MVCLPLQMGSPSLLACVLCPKRLTCREYGLLALPSSQLVSANRRHQYNIRAQAVSVFLLGNTESFPGSSVCCIPCRLSPA